MALSATKLARAHGAFNVVSGLWPLLHLPSFELVSGPKVDRWLVRTVAGLLLGNGTLQLAAPGSAERVAQARRLGLSTAATLLVIDVVYVVRGRISKVYLVDAAAEAAWVAAWVLAPTADASSGSRPRSLA
jgi:hypothetical protein